MSLITIMTSILQLDPHNVVTVELDDFDPYLVFQPPQDIQQEMDNLSPLVREQLDEWVEERLNNLRSDGSSSWK